MLTKVTFFIKEIHAGTILRLVDKYAIEMAMTPVNGKTAKTVADATDLVGRVRDTILAMPVGAKFNSKAIRNSIREWGGNAGRTSQILDALQKQGTIKRVKVGVFKRLAS